MPNLPHDPITVIAATPTPNADLPGTEFPSLKRITVVDLVGPAAANQQHKVLEKRDETLRTAVNKLIELANALDTTYLRRDGAAPKDTLAGVRAAMPFNNNKATGVGDATIDAASQDAVNGRQMHAEQTARVAGDAALNALITKGYQLYQTAGGFSFPIPAGVKSVTIWYLAGGGGGGAGGHGNGGSSGGGGGGAGGSSGESGCLRLDTPSGGTITGTVGAGGTGGVPNGGAGVHGGDTSVTFGAQTYTALGGRGGPGGGSNSSSGDIGGAAVDVVYPSGRGGNGNTSPRSDGSDAPRNGPWGTPGTGGDRASVGQSDEWGSGGGGGGVPNMDGGIVNVIPARPVGGNGGDGGNAPGGNGFDGTAGTLGAGGGGGGGGGADNGGGDGGDGGQGGTGLVLIAWNY